MNITKTLLTLTFLLTVVACGGESRTKNSSAPAQDNMQTTQAPAADQNEPVESCLEQNCSYEISRCDSICQSLLDCVTGCTETFDTQESQGWCIDACINAAGEGPTRRLGALLTCYEEACQ